MVEVVRCILDKVGIFKIVGVTNEVDQEGASLVVCIVAVIIVCGVLIYEALF
jgi:hypothetical protein